MSSSLSTPKGILSNRRWVLAGFSILSLLLGLALCVFLISHFNLQKADWLTMWQAIAWGWLAVSFILTAFMMLVGAWKWQCWMRAAHSDHEQAYQLYLRRYNWQVWVAQFVPLPVAVIAGRSASAAMDGQISWQAAARNGIWDQAYEFLALVLFTPLSLLIIFDVMDWASWLSTGFLTLVLFLVWWGVIKRFGPLWLRKKNRLLIVLSLVRVWLMTIRLVALLLAFALPLSLLNVVSAVPVLSLLSLIPVTPGNLGIGEWGWVGLLSYAGENPQQVVIYALAVRVATYLMQSLWLMLCLVFSGNHHE